jgi:carbonic anhydrase/acetyltransferase-like protein (isoleucine patch superfamily)
MAIGWAQQLRPVEVSLWPADEVVSTSENARMCTAFGVRSSPGEDRDSDRFANRNPGILAVHRSLCKPEGRSRTGGYMAVNVQFEDDNGQMVRYVRHANGGGLVSPQARVHEGAMVASTAYVEAGARVGDGSRIGAGSWLDHDVIVAEDVVVAGNVHLGPRTRAEEGTWIGTGARVGSDVVIARGARVAPDAVVRDSAVVRRRAASGGSEFKIAA